MSVFKILSLRLVLCRRFLSKGTREVVYTPDAPFQLLLGSNGYGKSSLINECSPLPGVKRDYAPGGSKEIKISNGVDEYRLFSDFSRGNKHEFWKNDVNLNDGGTFTIQKKLVEEHFKYSQDVHDMLMGRVRFTDLSPAQRKEWLVRLSPNDVSYALKVHRELLTRARNITGAHKHNAGKIIETIDQLLSADALKRLQDESAEMLDKTQKLYSIKSNVPSFSEEESKLIRNFKESAPRISKLLKQIEEATQTSPSINIDEIIEDIRFNLHSANVELRVAMSEYERFEAMLNNIEYKDGRSNSDIRNENTMLQTYLAASTPIEDWSVPSDPQRSAKTLDDISPAFLDYVLGLSPNPKKALFNPETYQGTLEKYNALQKVCDTRDNHLLRAHARLKEMEEAIKVSCGKCGHEWKLNYSENEAKKIQKFIALADKEDKRDKTEMESLLNYAQDYSRWEKTFSYIQFLIRDYPELKFLGDALFSVVDGKQVFFDSPEQLQYLLPRMRHFVQQHAELSAAKLKLEENETILTRRLAEEQLNTGNIVSRLEELEAIITDKQTAVKLYSLEITHYMEEKAIHENVIRVTKEADDIITRYNEACKKEFQVGFDEVLDTEIKSLHIRIAKLTEQINEAKAKEAILDHLEGTQEELERDKYIYGLLLDNISPTGGLIADILMGFINTLTAQFNDTIRKIWTTPLYVMPCALDKGDLDYKFPLQSVDVDNGVSDVSEGSTGEQEIINFVFMLLARLYLGFTGHPMFMDEVGRSFHERHRANLYNYVKLLVESKVIHQVFAISHHESTHNTLVHADVNVLDPTGVLVTPGANKCLLIK